MLSTFSDKDDSGSYEGNDSLPHPRPNLPWILALRKVVNLPVLSPA